MAAKKKAAKAGAGAVAAGEAIRSNEYLQRVLNDPELQENLRNAYGSARKAYGRINGKGVKAVTDDKKTQKELKEAAASLKEAADQFRGKKKKKRRWGRLLVLAPRRAARWRSDSARACARRCSTRSSAPRRSSSTRPAPRRTRPRAERQRARGHQLASLARAHIRPERAPPGAPFLV